MISDGPTVRYSDVQSRMHLTENVCFPVDNSVQALEGMIGERDAKIDALTKDLNRRTSSIEVRKFSINSGTAPTKVSNLQE